MVEYIWLVVWNINVMFPNSWDDDQITDELHVFSAG